MKQELEQKILEEEMKKLQFEVDILFKTEQAKHLRRKRSWFPKENEEFPR